MQAAVVISLIIVAVHVCFLQGMVLGWLRIWMANKLDKAFGLKWSRYIQKPLWDCLPCMASIWTILLTQHIDVLLILTVCGLNCLIEISFFSDETITD